MTPKEKIVALLQESGEILSGEELSSSLGISRVAVWKHIQGLVKSGVAVESSPKGYLLRTDADSLLPHEFGERSGRIHFFWELSSTMDKAIELARQGCRTYTVVIAEKQTSGRGRMARQWVSEEGGLYFTVVARPTLPLSHSGVVNLAAAVEMAAVLRSKCAVPASVKWPNDILVEGRKICGILSQMEIEGETVQYISIGIGLNVNNPPVESAPEATSLKMLTGRRWRRKEILAEFLDRFEKRCSKFDADEVINDWKAINSTIGKSVRIVTIKDTFTGTAVDIDRHGGLILEQQDGRRQTVVHGDCFYA